MWGALAGLVLSGEGHAKKEGGSSGFATGQSFQNALDPLNIFGGSSSSVLGNIVDPGNVFGGNPQLQHNPRVGGVAGTPGSGSSPMNTSSMATGFQPWMMGGLNQAYSTFLQNLGAPPMAQPPPVAAGGAGTAGANMPISQIPMNPQHPFYPAFGGPDQIGTPYRGEPTQFGSGADPYHMAALAALSQYHQSNPGGLTPGMPTSGPTNPGAFRQAHQGVYSSNPTMPMPSTYGLH